MANKYDIFISYRRDDGQQHARLIEKELKSRGYNVFLDYEELDKGLFDEKIVGAIASAKIFLMVLTPLYLSRCNKEGDWVRKEIQLAIDQKKEFVPVVPDGLFKEIPVEQVEGLPTNIKDVVDRVQRTEVFMGQMMKPSFDYLVKHRLRPFVRPKLMLKTWMTIVSGIVLVAMVGSYLLMNYLNGQVEQHRQTIMHQLENQYASWGFNFGESENVTIGQLNAVSSILEGMHPVKGDSLRMGAFEVTNAQWYGIMNKDYNQTDSLLPKTNVRLGDCMDFCLLLSDLTSLEFDMPLEEEWVFAARGGYSIQNTIYAGSNTADSVAWYKDNAKGSVRKCDGEKYPNALGLYNMSGNVSEWCNSAFDASGNIAQKVVKGGNYMSNEQEITIDYRESMDENAHNEKVGFRLVIRK